MTAEQDGCTQNYDNEDPQASQLNESRRGGYGNEIYEGGSKVEARLRTQTSDMTKTKILACDFPGFIKKRPLA